MILIKKKQKKTAEPTKYEDGPRLAVTLRNQKGYLSGYIYQ